MQTQDYSLPGFRDELLSHVIRNNFQSLASCHAGEDAPPNPFDGMLWYKPSAEIVYQFKEASGDWVPVIYAGTKNLGRVLRFTLTQDDINNKYITLPWLVVHPEVLVLIIVGAPPPAYNVDYSIDGDRLRWDSLVLDGLLREGDRFVIEY